MAYYDLVHKGFTKHSENGVIFYTVDAFNGKANYVFCGDVSNNLDFKTIRNATTQSVIKGYEKLCAAANIPFESLILANIVHGNTVEKIEVSNSDKTLLGGEKLPPCDGLITKLSNIPLATTHADCMPIAFVDPVKKVVCSVHAGWRGVLSSIDKVALNTFVKEYGSNKQDILVAIGPTIHESCFEVDKDLGKQFLETFSKEKYVTFNDEKANVDLLSIVLDNLEDFGIPPKNVTLDDRCTKCHPDNLHSFRRDKGECGTMVQIIYL